MIKQLIKLANHLDSKGLKKEADCLDMIIKKSISGFGNTDLPEGEKYLHTLMADMGLLSLDELSPEERKRYREAARPQPIVEKKLKEMGYKV